MSTDSTGSTGSAPVRKYTLSIERGVAPERVRNFSIRYRAAPKVDLRSKVKVMYDQGNIGSCTANALCYAYVFDAPTFTPSRLFLYYNERVLDGGDYTIDDGSTLSQGIHALETYGVCKESSWPYITNNIAVKPSKSAYVEGVKNEVLMASRVLQTLDSMKGCLISGYPFVVGFEVYSSFESASVASTGMVPMPNTATEQLLGGHACICLGYDDSKGVWIMQNSWGTGWGDRGYFYMPYAYLTTPALAGDMWRILKVTTKAASNVAPNVSLRLKYQKMYNYKPLNLPVKNSQHRGYGPINPTSSTGPTGSTGSQ
jgi:C1A family cysteine protease